MPLFKRRDRDEDEEEPSGDQEGREEEQPPEEDGLYGDDHVAREDAEDAPAEGGDEDLDAELAAIEEQILGGADAEGLKDEGEDEEDDEDEPSIDELLDDDVFGGAQGAPGAADVPVERDEGLDELAGEDVHLLKIAKKVVVVGDPAVGKTSLIKRYVKDVFDDRYLNTIGAKVMKKNVGFNHPETGEVVDLKLILWDIAGQESFAEVKKAYYRGASGAIVMCDVTRKETMEDMHRWIDNLFDVSDVVPMVIIVNKIDLEDEAGFSVEDVVEEYAPYGSKVFPTSAKTGLNVEMVFLELGKKICCNGV